MKIKLNIKENILVIIGAAIFLLVLIAIFLFRNAENPDEQLAYKARRLDLVARMYQNLTSSSEAEKSAVMAITDQDSRMFADQARESEANVALDCQELEKLLARGGTQSERDSLKDFTRTFAELQRIDNELLELAVKNSNIKAFSLAFGPAADALNEMDTALTNLIVKTAHSPDAGTVTLHAFGAQTSALRIQTLLAPHIAERSDKKMDDLESVIANENKKVINNLAELAKHQKLKLDADLFAAKAAYGHFNEIQSQIFKLSRENTNIRSLVISLGEKRKVMFQCQDILTAIRKAILEEPIADVNYGLVSNPRSLEDHKSNQGK